jgi:hypothetical protein
MNYFISRDGQQYGPYTLADLQRYVASGDILTSDLATSEGMTTPVPVGQIIGNIAAPIPYPANAGPIPAATIWPTPPNLHWGLVLLFSVVSCGIFSIVWDLVQSAWMKKIEPASQSLYYYIGAAILLLCFYSSSFIAGMTRSGNSFGGLIELAYVVLLLIGRFKLRTSLERHYNIDEPMGLALSGVMTFFFGCIYFQYHLNDIMKRKTIDQLYGAR